MLLKIPQKPLQPGTRSGHQDFGAGRVVHVYTQHLARPFEYPRGRAKPKILHLPPIRSPKTEIGRLVQKANQQQAIFHHTPIDWVIWKELRISFSLMAWIL